MKANFKKIDIETCGEIDSWYLPHYYQAEKNANNIFLGKGGFGFVLKFWNSNLNKNVAVKKLINPMKTSEHSKRIFRELFFLNEMAHPHVIQLIEAFTSKIGEHNNPPPTFDIYIVTSLVESDLDKIIKCYSLEESTIEKYTYQLLCGLNYIHSAGIIHRDLKPQNIGVTKSGIKILDFGISRNIPSDSSELTPYIITRYYRAPEIIYNWGRYSTLVDVWSLGCIIVEMYNREVFISGDNKIHQLNLIIEIFGNPPEYLINRLSEDAQLYLRSLNRKEPQDLRALIVRASDRAIDLITRMLQMDPDYRITVKEALKHCYVSNHKDAFIEWTRDPIEFINNPDVHSNWIS